LLKKRVLSSLTRVLKEKGFKPGGQNEVDFVAVAQAGIKERMQVTTWGGYGWYSPGWGGYRQTDISYYEEGNLVINIVDTQTKELAWRGVATGILKEQASAEDKQKYLDNVVGKILKNFPPAQPG